MALSAFCKSSKHLAILDTGLIRTIALFAPPAEPEKQNSSPHDLLPQGELNGAYTYTVDFWASKELP